MKLNKSAHLKLAEMFHMHSITIGLKKFLLKQENQNKHGIIMDKKSRLSFCTFWSIQHTSLMTDRFSKANTLYCILIIRKARVKSRIPPLSPPPIHSKNKQNPLCLPCDSTLRCGPFFRACFALRGSNTHASTTAPTLRSAKLPKQ